MYPVLSTFIISTFLFLTFDIQKYRNSDGNTAASFFDIHMYDCVFFVSFTQNIYNILVKVICLILFYTQYHVGFLFCMNDIVVLKDTKNEMKIERGVVIIINICSSCRVVNIYSSLSRRPHDNACVYLMYNFFF